MKETLPDWYRGWADAVLQLRAAQTSDLAFERSAWLRGYLAALFMANLITYFERERLADVGINALRHAVQALMPQPPHKKEA